MKYKVASIAITLPIIILVGSLFMMHTHNISATSIQTVQQMEAYVRERQWDNAQQVLTSISNEWETNKPMLQLWVVHADTDAVSSSINEAQVGLTLRNENIFFMGTARLIESLEHLHHKDDLNLANII